MNKKKTIVCVLLVLAVTAAAVVSGFFAGHAIAFAVRQKPNYNFDVTAYTESISDIAYTSKDSPLNRRASDAFIIANHLLSQKNYYNITGEGLVETGHGKIGSLKLWGSAEKENGTIHTSIVAYNKIIKKYQVGLKYDYDIANDSIDFYYGSSHGDGSTDWQAPSHINKEQYIAEWGLSPENFFTYTISSKTAKKNEKPKAILIGNETLYEYTLVLDPVYSVSNYAKQLGKMSELDNLPDFSYVEFSFVVDKDFTLRSVKIHEKYSVYMYGMLVTCDGNTAYTFEY